jgi:hypothetical protein
MLRLAPLFKMPYSLTVKRALREYTRCGRDESVESFSPLYSFEEVRPTGGPKAHFLTHSRGADFELCRQHSNSSPRSRILARLCNPALRFLVGLRELAWVPILAERSAALIFVKYSLRAMLYLVSIRCIAQQRTARRMISAAEHSRNVSPPVVKRRCHLDESEASRTAPRSTSNWSSESRSAKRGTGPPSAGFATSGRRSFEIRRMCGAPYRCARSLFSCCRRLSASISTTIGGRWPLALVIKDPSPRLICNSKLNLGDYAR